MPGEMAEALASGDMTRAGESRAGPTGRRNPSPGALLTLLPDVAQVPLGCASYYYRVLAVLLLHLPACLRPGLPRPSSCCHLLLEPARAGWNWWGSPVTTA